MTITLIDYQLLGLLVAAWASGCVTLYISEERRARKEYRKRMARKALLMQGYNAGLEAFKGDEGFNAFPPETIQAMWGLNKHIDEAMKIANGEDNKED
jgi:hypothetical protein